MVPMFTWQLSTVQYKVPDKDAIDQMTPMPVMTGRMFAMNKELYESTGGYDTDFEYGNV